VAVVLHRKSWTAAQYRRMVEVGVLGEDDRVELIQGEIIEMAPVGAHHAAAVKALARLFHQQTGDRCVVSVQDPIRLSDRSEPQPDVALLTWRDDLYRAQLPIPPDVLLVVEVADTSAATDREVKLPGYGQAGIPEAWLVDLTTGVVEAHSHPSAGGYTESVVYRRGDTLPAIAIPGIAIPVTAVIGTP
jgi:Uma2 family endonuclease